LFYFFGFVFTSPALLLVPLQQQQKIPQQINPTQPQHINMNPPGAVTTVNKARAHAIKKSTYIGKFKPMNGASYQR